MNQILNNSDIYIQTSEKEVSSILSHFNSQYVMDIIESNLKETYKSFYTGMVNPNIVKSFEDYFKNMLNAYPFDRENIQLVREETYSEIINIICNKYNLSYIADTESVDTYSAAFYLYDFLVSKFAYNFINFFSIYFIKEKDALYKGFNLDNFKKSKDSSTLYAKKIFKDQKIAIINSNIGYVLPQMSEFDISFNNIIDIVYNKSKVAYFIQQNFIDNGNFYKNFYVPLFKDPNLLPGITTSIHLTLQQLCSDDNITLAPAA